MKTGMKIPDYRRGPALTAMSINAIAAELGCSKQLVHYIIRRALGKLRAQPALMAGFREAVGFERRKIGYAVGPWNDIDAELDIEGSADLRV